jgi:hypothetical protein
MHERFRVKRVEALAEPSRIEIDGVDLGQNLAALKCQLWSNLVEFGGAHNSCPKSDAIEPLHDESFAETVRRLKDVMYDGFGDTHPASHLHEHGFHGKSGSSGELAFVADSARRPTHGYPFFAR